MRRLLSTVVVLAWGLWFGGIVMVFVAVTSLFRTFHDQRPLAGAAAAGVFTRFEAMQLGVAAVAVLAALGLWASARSRARVAAATLLAVAAVGALASSFAFTPRVQDMRRRGIPSTSEEFRTAHRASSIIYVLQTGVLLSAGLFLPAAIAGPPSVHEAPHD
jgi:hypothetical protein